MSGPQTDAIERAIESGLTYALEPRLAPHYERHLVEECGYLTPSVMARELAQRRASGRFVDLGAGSGLVGKALGAHELSIELIAVDMSEAMLELIECPLYVEKHRADVGKLDWIAPATIDGALAAGLLEHIARPAIVFGEIARIVRPSGTFLFSFPPNEHGCTELFAGDDGLVSHGREQIRDDLERAGFELWSEHEFVAYVDGSGKRISHRLVRAQRR